MWIYGEKEEEKERFPFREAGTLFFLPQLNVVHYRAERSSNHRSVDHITQDPNPPKGSCV